MKYLVLLLIFAVHPAYGYFTIDGKPEPTNMGGGFTCISDSGDRYRC